jgi:hypothetical protein
VRCAPFLFLLFDTDPLGTRRTKVFKKSQVIEAFTDPKLYLFFIINCLLNVPNSGLTTFNSIIVASLGFSTKQTLLLAIPTGVISWISSIGFALLAVKVRISPFTHSSLLFSRLLFMPAPSGSLSYLKFN